MFSSISGLDVDKTVKHVKTWIPSFLVYPFIFGLGYRVDRISTVFRLFLYLTRQILTILKCFDFTLPVSWLVWVWRRETWGSIWWRRRGMPSFSHAFPLHLSINLSLWRKGKFVWYNIYYLRFVYVFTLSLEELQGSRHSLRQLYV